MTAYSIFASMRGKKARLSIEIIIHALFWLGAYYVLKALTVSSFQMVVVNNGARMAMNGQTLFPYAGIQLICLLLLFYSNIGWLLKKTIRIKSTLIGVTVVTAWLMLLFTVNYEIVRLLVSSSATKHRLPLPGMANQPITSFSPGDWLRLQPLTVIIFLSVFGISVAYFFIREWIRNDLRRSQVEASQLSTEIRFLRSQINPHFLFNTLNNLFSMAQKKGNDELADGISKLSGMMRYMMDESSSTDTVALQKEIEYLEDCIALSKLRYADSEVSVSFRHPPQAEIAKVQVAPMLFISFLENAFKHGVLIGHNSHIIMSITIDSKKLIFACENTDHSAVRRPVEERAGIGLENIRRRLQLLYAGRHQLRTGPEDGKYCVNLQIDLA